MRGTGPDRRVVRYDPMLPSAGIFSSLGNGPRPKLDAQCEFAGVKWRLRGPDQLGIPEQTLLLVLLGLAEDQYAETPSGGHDWAALEASLYSNLGGQPLGAHREGRQAPLALATVRASYAELSHRCGRKADGGSAAGQIRRELERLCEVTVWATLPGGEQYGSRLLQWRRGDRWGVQVLLNARLTEILVGQQYSPVSLEQRLALETDIARALHCVLSVRIRRGGTMSFRWDTLAAYVWWESSVQDVTVRRRRQQLRAALADIGHLAGWTVSPMSGGSIAQAKGVHISRRSAATTKTMPISFRGRSRAPVKANVESTLTQGPVAVVDASSLFV